MLAGRAVIAAGAVGGGAAPDALVAAGTVAVLLRGRMVAARAVARRATVFAMLLVVAMLVFAGGAVVTAAAVTRASAVSAFRAHDAFLSSALVYHNLGGCGGKMSAELACRNEYRPLFHHFSRCADGVTDLINVPGPS